jgi:hypothetical protein
VGQVSAAQEWHTSHRTADKTRKALSYLLVTYGAGSSAVKSLIKVQNSQSASVCAHPELIIAYLPV